MITLNNGKELQLELHKKHEKRKRRCPRRPMLDDDLLTPTEETKEKETPKKTEKQKAEEMEKMFDDGDDDDDEGHEKISDILGRIDLAGNDEGKSILSSSSDSPYLKKVEVDVHRLDDQTLSSFDTPRTKKFKIDVHSLDDPSPCKSVSSVSNPKLDKLAVEKHKLLSKSHVSSEDSYVEDKQSTDRMSCNDDNDPGSDLHKDDDNSNKKAQSDESCDKDFSEISGDQNAQKHSIIKQD